MKPLSLYNGFFVQNIPFSIEKNKIHLMIKKLNNEYTG